jgi:hypothetical protein
MADYKDVVLRIYKAPSGQWAGVVLDDDDEEVGGVAGCSSPEDVEDAAYDAGFDFVRVEIMLAPCVKPLEGRLN